MYLHEPFTGSDLPPKTLCLTYDDGPGKHTSEIAEFLYQENIKATFFVVGKYALHQHDVLKKVSALGHLIGNHTYEHPDMPYYLSKSGDVQNQVLRTDAVIKKYIENKTIFFRSPYGKWSKEVANELNLNLLCTINHCGPIRWDVGGIDCYYWNQGFSVEAAVEKYVSDIRQADHGIVVMHDEIADMNYLKDSNKTFELTKRLVPILKKQGYKFVRLDEIKSIIDHTSKSLRFTLKSASGKNISLATDESNLMTVNGRKNSKWNELSLEELDNSKIALKAANGLFLSLQESEFAIKATGNKIGAGEEFDLIPVSSNKILLRAYNGNYLTKENKHGTRLLAKAEYMRGGDIFSFSPVDAVTKKSISLKDRFTSLNRQFSYVMSKIRQGA